MTCSCNSSVAFSFFFKDPATTEISTLSLHGALPIWRWHVVVAVLGEPADDDLAWWVDTLRGATAAPRLIAVAHGPSMGLVLRAEKLGVLDVLPLPEIGRASCRERV